MKDTNLIKRLFLAFTETFSFDNAIVVPDSVALVEGLCEGISDTLIEPMQNSK